MLKCGVMISEISFPNFAVLFKSSGLDFFIVDCEHGGFDYKDISAMIMNARLCGLESIIRLSGNERKDIIKYMDMGADGVLLPMTGRAEDIEFVVRYAKYRPIGKRGISTMRAHTLYSPPEIKEYMRSANSRTKVYAQIETVEGVSKIDSILAVNGVSGCFIGPNDLADDYGCIGEKQSPQILSAIKKIGKAANIAKKNAGIITTDVSYIKQAKMSGFCMFCKGSEINAVREYTQNICKSLRELK